MRGWAQSGQYLTSWIGTWHFVPIYHTVVGWILNAVHIGVSNFLFAGTIKVISAKLSKSGFPLVVLATRHAFLFDTSLMCWLRVADDCFPASNFASSWNMGSVHGELAGLQVDVRKFLARKPGWSRSVCFLTVIFFFLKKKKFQRFRNMFCHCCQFASHIVN